MILFIGDGYALGDNAGAILYRRIMEVYGIENFCYFGIGNRTRKRWPSKYDNMPKELHSLRIWPRIRGLKYLKKIPFIEEFYYFIKIPFVRYRLKRFVKKNNIDRAFILLRADVLSILSDPIIIEDIKHIGFISDTVKAEQADKKRIYKLKRDNYYKAIRNFDGIFVAGEAMDNYIKNNYSQKTAILRLGYENNIPETFTMSKDNSEIHIFFGGSVYAKNEIEIFAQALSQFQKENSNYQLVFTIASNYKLKKTYDNISIEELGWQSERTLIAYMQNSHLGYAPYKFDDKSKHHMSYAFPSKIGFYLSAGLPIFFHGPDYSSVGKFFNNYKCGVHCSSLEVKNIVKQIEEILLDKNVYDNLLSETRVAFENEFSLDVLGQNFKKLIE
ncbi:MAG: hypothetical protein U5R06_03855 [candidate division KSB1 bacterium]|nr:hypothetical protein [candidate division KSB1 bacterium]